jgi:hypothetical protein
MVMPFCQHTMPHHLKEVHGAPERFSVFVERGNPAEDFHLDFGLKKGLHIQCRKVLNGNENTDSENYIPISLSFSEHYKYGKKEN